MSDLNWKTTTILPTLKNLYMDSSYDTWLSELQAPIPQLIAEGKTDGWCDTSHDYDNQTTTIHRFWATEADANAWCEWSKSKPFNNIVSTYEVTFIG